MSTIAVFRPAAHWGYVEAPEPCASGSAGRIEQAIPVRGAGPQARRLDEQILEVTRVRQRLEALGFEPPPRGPIPVALAGVRELDWHLEPDETDF